MFDTAKFLDRPPLVSGIQHFRYCGNCSLDQYLLQAERRCTGYEKNLRLVVELKKWVDVQYDEGRVTVLTDHELVDKINEISETMKIDF